ncbi:hypothetical protein LguiB_026510 [Lonicera macranthoides]
MQIRLQLFKRPIEILVGNFTPNLKPLFCLFVFFVIFILQIYSNLNAQLCFLCSFFFVKSHSHSH